jgi:demethylmenaquinone methyltransferase/2-methoxy-6-polyprenyl-1,4-benzoquinol methylase
VADEEKTVTAEREWAVGSEDEVLNQQRVCYRGRAPEYDEWWQRRGRYDRGVEDAREWHRQVASVDAALRSFGVKGDVLEFAGGTGWWIERLARTADRLTVVDAAPEALGLNRQRVGREDVSYVIADLFDWRPERSYDVVFFSFWLSHVPRRRFSSFWGLVRASLRSTGRVFFIDNRVTTQPSTLRLRGIPRWSSTGLTFTGAAWAMAPNISWSR